MMNMQTIQLNISNDIFDKVMSFLEILPKNKGMSPKHQIKKF